MEVYTFNTLKKIFLFTNQFQSLTEYTFFKCEKFILDRVSFVK